jgi:hypothetical protein
VFGLCFEERQHHRDAAMDSRYYSLLPGGTVHAANSGDAHSQTQLGALHFMFAARLDILQGAPADDGMVAARWAEALSFLERAAEQGDMGAQVWCGQIYATGDRSVPQNWATAVKWWRKAAEAGRRQAQWFIGLCYYYGRGVNRDVAQAKVWIRKSSAQGYPAAERALQQAGIPGEESFARDAIVRLTNAGSSAPRYAVAREFAEQLNKTLIKPLLQQYIDRLRESDYGVPHRSLRDSIWVEFMVIVGISEEELELAKNIYAYSLRTCAFCGSNSAPLRKCSLCMDVRYCIGTECQHGDWNKAPTAESHKVLCPRIFVRGSKGRTRRAGM